MEKTTARQLTRWEEWQAPVTTVAILTALVSTIFISNQTARLLAQGGLLFAGGVHIYHDRKRPLLFAEISTEGRHPSGPPLANGAPSITNIDGTPLSTDNWRSLIDVTFSNQEKRRTWWGGKPATAIHERNPFFPNNLMPSKGTTSTFRHLGYLVQVTPKGEGRPSQKEPFIHAEMSLALRDTGLYGTGHSSSRLLAPITDVDGQSIGQTFNEQLVYVLFNFGEQRTWHGRKEEELPMGNTIMPVSLLSQAIDGKLLFRYNGILIEARKDADFDSLFSHIAPPSTPLMPADLPESWVVFNRVPISKEGGRLTQEWERVQLGSQGTFELSPEQTVPDSFRSFKLRFSPDPYGTFNLPPNRTTSLTATGGTSIDILKNGDQLYIICPARDRKIPGARQIGGPGLPTEHCYQITLPEGVTLDKLRYTHQQQQGVLQLSVAPQ